MILTSTYICWHSKDYKLNVNWVTKTSCYSKPILNLYNFMLNGDYRADSCVVKLHKFFSRLGKLVRSINLRMEIFTLPYASKTIQGCLRVDSRLYFVVTVSHRHVFTICIAFLP